RHNLNLRQHLARLGRKSLSFSKSVELHDKVIGHYLNNVVPVLNLSVFNVRRAPAFAFEQSKRATIGGRFIRVD
ncbi:IS1 family transposase, partial [Escherichia coli]|nr:IS1 family transposase [Escherichia coli]